MTHKEVALSLIGLMRETLGLIAYNNVLKSIFMRENADIQSYYSCLKKIRKCFKINDNTNHSDTGSTDSNSDNNSDSNNESNSKDNSDYKISKYLEN